MIAVDGQPFSLMEDVAFHRLLHHLAATKQPEGAHTRLVLSGLPFQEVGSMELTPENCLSLSLLSGVGDWSLTFSSWLCFGVCAGEIHIVPGLKSHSLSLTLCCESYTRLH